MKRRRTILVYLAVTFAVFDLRGLLLAPVAPHVRWDGDSGGYLIGPTWIGDSLVGQRPPVVPALYHLLGSNFAAIVLVQSLLAAACWTALAFAVTSLLHARWLRPSAILIVLAFSFAPEVLWWERELLSESVSLSLFALLLASCCWWLHSGPSPATATPNS